MKRVMCGKIAVAYQNVDIGKGNVVYKVSPKAGQQQCADGSSKTSCKLSDAHNLNDIAAWNIIAMTMCFRPQSPDLNACLASSLSCTPSSNSPSTTSSRASSDGEKLPLPSCTTTSTNTSILYSGLGSPLKGVVDEEKRSRSGYSTDSDEEKSTVSHYEDQYEAIRVIQSYGTRPDSSRSFWPQPHEPPMDKTELCSSSSSIGGNDDSSCSLEGGEVSTLGDMEVESALREGPLQDMSALEASLPAKRGLSRFWNGKAKSFSSLAEVSSVEELAKPDNPYAKRRRTTFGERHKSFPSLSHTSTTGISKRPPSNSGSRGGLAMAVAMGSKLVQEPNKQLHSPAYAYSNRSMSLTDLAHSYDLRCRLKCGTYQYIS